MSRTSTGAALACCTFAVLSGAAVSAGTLADAPANAWVKVEWSETGGRHSPAFFYVPELKRFVLASGVPIGGEHFVVEEFDLASGKWINAYPQGAPASYQPESGPTKAPPHPPRGWPGKGRTVADPKGVSRIGYFGNAYSADSRVHFQYAYAPDQKRLFAYLWNMTMAYDPFGRKWTDLKAKPSPADNDAVIPGGHTEMIWGSLCCDPVNKEIVSVGGTAACENGSPGTWVYSMADNAWRRLELDTPEKKAAREKLLAEQKRVWALLSACRNRFFAGETDAEARVDLAALVEKVPLPAPSVEWRRVAPREKVTAETIAVGQAVHNTIERNLNALAVEPPPRALSQMAYDASSRKIVLFGGDGLDRHYADTWVYDCATRAWEQRYPKLSPSPRAGHALLYLPKSRKILLLGGFGLGNGHSYMYGDVYRRLPFEMWAYDTAKNAWALLAHLPLPKRRQEAPNTPRGDYRGTWPAAVTDDDTVVLFQTGIRGRVTWACKVDPSKVDAEGTAKFGVPPGTVAFRGDEDTPRPGYRSYDPAFYERGATPDPTWGERTFGSLPLNTWTLLQPPRGVDVCGWGTTAFDADRQQLLYWGGGHSEYKGTNVFHYSLRTGLWSSSCRPDWVLEWSGGFLCPALLSFRNRPHIPVHAYQCYAYDPPSGRMVAVRGTTFLYSVAAREWEFPPIATPFRGGVMHVSLETTPRGAVCWAEQRRGSEDAKLWLFDGRGRAWKRLPQGGPKIRAPWCDGSGMCYDSRRDCLWLAPGNELFRYEFQSGAVSKVETRVPKVLGRFALWREQVFVPEAGLILLMRLFQAPDGHLKNVAYDPGANKWYFIDVPFVSGGKPHAFRKGRRPFSWNSAIHYAPKFKVVLLHHPVAVWALRLDRKAAKMTEMLE